MIAHPKGREKALERFGWTGRPGRAFGLQPSAQPLGQVVLLGSHVRTALLSDATGPRSWDPAPSGSPCPGVAPLGPPPARRRRHLPSSNLLSPIGDAYFLAVHAEFEHILARLSAAAAESTTDGDDFESIVARIRQELATFTVAGVSCDEDTDLPTGYEQVFTKGSRVCHQQAGANGRRCRSHPANFDGWEAHVSGESAAEARTAAGTPMDRRIGDRTLR